MFLYILRNRESGKFYIGITKDIARRMREHNSDNTHFTGRQRESWDLIFLKYYEYENEARKEELRLKRSRNKQYLQWYIDQNAGS